jgi:ATP-dependent exoDNAse (exonuclease V) beta subunit
MPAKSNSGFPDPPDQEQRIIALDPHRSVLVQAPAGSGKTDLLTRRYLRLLADVSDPSQIVAVTFTKAAAAEMRHRILDELEKADKRIATGIFGESNEWSMESLATRALEHSRRLNWRLIELSSQLRISTIDSFCRDLAIQQPIHSGIGNNLQITERPAELYRTAARLTLEKLGDSNYAELSTAIRELLLWRDNNWKELEELLVKMLSQRDRWMLDFVLQHGKDWERLRQRLERPMANAVRDALEKLEDLISTDDRVEAHELARFACIHGGGDKYRGLAELAEFPAVPQGNHEALEEARGAYLCVAKLLLKNDGAIRQKIDSRLGFPKEHLDEKLRMEDLLERLAELPGLENALARVRNLPPARYAEEDWQIIRASFTVLRHAAAELKAVFAEAGAVDFIEVAQIARGVLRGEDNLPSDAAQAMADEIHHLLIDEFQDTSRRQLEFITALIEAWSDPANRTIFVVGDPMQSIYFFRDAEAELFSRVKNLGFELTGGEGFPLNSVSLSANFRSDPGLVAELNETFERVFEVSDGSGIEFARAKAARLPADSQKKMRLHLAFVPQPRGGAPGNPDFTRMKQQIAAECELIRKSQIEEIVSVIRGHLDHVEAARLEGKRYRIAVLGRARTAIAPIASALREAGISFRAVELENLSDRPEILDAVALSRALFNPEDRVAWLGLLRAPWCGLELADLHCIAGTDEDARATRSIPLLMRERLNLLTSEPKKAVERVLSAYASIAQIRIALPTATAGTLIQQIWTELGGNACVDDAGRANLALFWRLLDSLPNGEQDVVGSALDAALADLCALPDPTSSCDFGVQLMTIHKSKGLEFEVVIVPDLQAQGGRGSAELLSWFERGLLEPDEDGALSEFLVAPVQYKGTDPGAAKRWVDGARRDRETQEMRRILYVAATRAREELHFFAQPTYKVNANREEQLVEPPKSLLATAWPALGDEIRARFGERPNNAQPSVPRSEFFVNSIAAAKDNLVVMPSPPIPTMIRRISPDFATSIAGAINEVPTAGIVGRREPEGYTRHEGNLSSRALGNAVHGLLEELSRLRKSFDWDASRAALERLRPRTLAVIRGSGIAGGVADRISSEAHAIALQASQEPIGQWILSPHADAAAESGWAGVISGSLRQIRVDRIFRAGVAPLEVGDNALWIIDYKTAHADGADPAATAAELRETFRPQLEMYASILRKLRGEKTPIRAGLYYTRIAILDWWEI